MKLEELHDILYDLLCAVDDACRAEGVSYSLEGGTMLGAVRHKGFIPWDDDVDITIWKKDYPALRAALKKHLPPHYRLIEPEELAPNFYDFVARVQDLRHHWHEPTAEDLAYDNKQNYVCVDIFTLVSSADSPAAIKAQAFVHKIIYGLAMGHRVGRDTEKYSTLQKIETGILSAIGKLIPMKAIHALYHWFSDLFDNRKHTCSMLTNDIPSYMGKSFDTAWMSETTDTPFRDRQFPIHAGYHEKLTMLYGDYMQPPKDRSAFIQHLKPDEE